MCCWWHVIQLAGKVGMVQVQDFLSENTLAIMAVASTIDISNGIEIFPLQVEILLFWRQRSAVVPVVAFLL